MTEQKEDRLRRIDVTWRRQTERLYACRGEDPGWWILYTPGDWKDAQTADELEDRYKKELAEQEKEDTDVPTV